ncbi:hypothetical protein B0H14DRAFT_2796618 [Mycena olivaceomarginata]|nr:hypothetical protein B0H14DRAFT_2796618 [Mycena olivaceomarginata]
MTRFCGYMFVLSPLVYPQWASSRRQLTSDTTGEAVVCGLREALGHSADCDYLSPPVHFTMTVPNVLGFFQLKSGRLFSTVKGSSTI